MSGSFRVLLAEGLRMAVGEDGVATVHMVNGENRFRLSFVKAWMKILEEVERNDSIKGLIITGTGKYFSLGLDLDYYASQTAEYVATSRSSNVALYRRIALLPVPTVAVINGHAYGAGAFLAISCDYRVMRSDRGWMCFPETALGMQIQERGLMFVRLKMGVGRPQRDAVVFSKRMSALESRDLGLVDVITTPNDMYNVAGDLIKQCLGKRGLKRDSLSRMKKDIYGFSSWEQDADAKL